MLENTYTSTTIQIGIIDLKMSETKRIIKFKLFNMNIHLIFMYMFNINVNNCM